MERPTEKQEALARLLECVREIRIASMVPTEPEAREARVTSVIDRLRRYHRLDNNTDPSADER
ncbi:hypothetical protein SAMN03159496_05584 [Rhizobium sp. NFR07]|nr:hypothetical protein SAMN03159496_05584 [Rhizobium sp. NFR07]